MGSIPTALLKQNGDYVSLNVRAKRVRQHSSCLQTCRAGTVHEALPWNLADTALKKTFFQNKYVCIYSVCMCYVHVVCACVCMCYVHVVCACVVCVYVCMCVHLLCACSMCLCGMCVFMLCDRHWLCRVMPWPPLDKKGGNEALGGCQLVSEGHVYPLQLKFVL